MSETVTCPVCKHEVRCVGPRKLMEPHVTAAPVEVVAYTEVDTLPAVTPTEVCAGSYRSAIQGIRVPRTSN